jgi:hypothetical protein
MEETLGTKGMIEGTMKGTSELAETMKNKEKL